MCKGSCNKVFHLDCIKTISYRVDRKIYFCKPCAKHNRQVLKKEKEEALMEQDEILSDENAGDNQNKRNFLEIEDNNAGERDSQNGSPTKTPRGRPRTAKKQLLTFYPIREDAETRRFLENTPELELLDKIIHREIYLIDAAQ